MPSCTPAIYPSGSQVRFRTLADLSEACKRSMILAGRASCGGGKKVMRRVFLLFRRRKTFLGLMAGIWIAAAAPGHAAGNTARAALDDVIETAKHWHPDAILTSVYTASADVDGRATSWAYGFYSPKNGKYLNVTAKGRSIDTLEITVGQSEPVPANFLDSDAVVAAASKAGMNADTMRMRLTKSQWLVNDGDQKGALSIWLNPRTGRLIKRQIVP